MFRTLRVLFLLLAGLVLLAGTDAAYCRSSHHYSSHPRSTVSSHTRSTGGRPYYGGGHHATSHGGSYPGSTNFHHKDGHYVNPRANNHYGIHQSPRSK